VQPGAAYVGDVTSANTTAFSPVQRKRLRYLIRVIDHGSNASKEEIP